MLDGILGRGFASKCKSLIKLTKSRIDVIRRKRNATQKFLKKDMADLLASRLDVNAFGRAEGLLAELTLSSCYDFVEHCCDFLLKHLSVMQKQRECPEECREAVASVMFAAARFSDLPELRDLRHAFHVKYGSSLDYCLNQVFSENMAPKPFTMEKKVRLMQEIASEFSVHWNARDFEQRMSKQPASEMTHPRDDALDQVANVKYGAPSGKEVPVRGDDLNFPSIKEQRVQKGAEANNFIRDEVLPPKWDHYSEGRKVLEECEVPITRKDLHDTPCRGKRESCSERKMKERSDPKIILSPGGKGDGYADNSKNHRGREKNVPERENMDILSHMKPGYMDHSAANSSWSQVKVAPFVTAAENVDTPFHLRSRYADNITTTSSTREVKVNSNVNNGDRIHSGVSPLARVTSEGDRSYLKTSGLKLDSFLKAEENVDTLLPAKLGNHRSIKSVERVKSEGDRPYLNGALPPPYVKPNLKARDVSHRADLETASVKPDFNKIPEFPPVHRSASSARGHKDDETTLYPDKGRKEASVPARGDRIGTDEKDNLKYWDEANGFPLPSKARSSRQRRSKSRSANDGARDRDDDAERVKRSLRSRRRDDPRRGLQILFDDERYQKDKEERVIDKLLMHYSEKPSTYEGMRVKRKSRRPHHDGRTDLGESPLSRRTETERPNEESRTVAPRSVSLPREQPSAPPQPAKVFTRAATFQADRSDAANHVHPKLPDYDDLAARFGALRGK